MLLRQAGRSRLTGSAPFGDDEELGGAVVGVQGVGGDHRVGQVQVGQQWPQPRGPRPARRRPGAGRAPRGWRGPSWRAGGPAGRLVRVWRRAASCRPPRRRVGAGWACGCGRSARRRWWRQALRGSGGPGCGGWWSLPAPTSGRGRRGGRRARDGSVAGRRWPIRRPRPASARRSRLRRRSWPGSSPVGGGGGHGGFVGRGWWPGSPAGPGLRWLQGVGVGELGERRWEGG